MELHNKSVAFLGDSITEGAGVSDLELRYDNRLRSAYGLKAAFNYGIGGTRLAHQIKPSEEPRYDLCFCGRAYDIDPSADVIVVFGGTNDYGHGDAQFGTMEDHTPETFCGAVDFLMRLLLERHPNSKIVFMTPARRVGDEAISVERPKHLDAQPLLGYVQVILQKGAQYGIPVLNLYDNLGINPNREEDCAAYTVDGLHLNDAGHEKLAELMREFINQL